MKIEPLPKYFWKELDIEPLSLPTFRCKVCGKEILDTPSNWIYKDVENSAQKEDKEI